MSFDDKSLFAKQLQAIASSSADGQAQAERIRSLLELQRQAHGQPQHPGNGAMLAGKRARLALT